MTIEQNLQSILNEYTAKISAAIAEDMQAKLAAVFNGGAPVSSKPSFAKAVSKPKVDAAPVAVEPGKRTRKPRPVKAPKAAEGEAVKPKKASPAKSLSRITPEEAESLQQNVLALLKLRPEGVSATVIIDTLALDRNRVMVQLRKMVQSGSIKILGTTRNAKYFVA